MKKRGFTIIEVVLVLAIAGLIFLMVFIALPALQRGQRNTQRKNDINRVMTAIDNYRANNSNKLPFGYDTSKRVSFFDENFVSRYIDGGVSGSLGSLSCSGDCSQFSDPNGELYGFYLWNSGKSYSAGTKEGAGNNDIKAKETDIWVFRGAKCDSEEGVAVGTGVSGNFALIYKLEGGAYYCVDNI